MATLTLKPGPRLLYLPWYHQQETVIPGSAHEYLFETIHVINSACLRDFVLLADGNPYLLGIYGRCNAVHLVMEALRLRAERVGPTHTTRFLLLSTNESGDPSLNVVSAADADRASEIGDAGELSFADVHTLPVRFEPFSNKTDKQGPAQPPATLSAILEPTLGEVLRLVFSSFEVEAANHDCHSREADREDTEGSFDDQAHLASYDSEMDEIKAEMHSEQDAWARSEESGWYYEE